MSPLALRLAAGAATALVCLTVGLPWAYATYRIDRNIQLFANSLPVETWDLVPPFDFPARAPDEPVVDTLGTRLLEVAIVTIGSAIAVAGALPATRRRPVVP